MTFIHKFEIENLFGYKNVGIDFSNPVKIIVGENGYGKTTILSCLYYLLTFDYENLLRYKFDSISIRVGFNNPCDYCFTRSQLKAYSLHQKRKKDDDMMKYISSKLSSNDMEELYSVYKKTLDYGSLINLIAEKAQMPDVLMKDYVLSWINNKREFHQFEEFNTAIASIGCKFLYFPKYRRIEEDIRNISHNTSKSSRSLESSFSDLELNSNIKFGMSDVENRINDILLKIRQSSVDGFSAISGKMLSRFLTNNSTDSIHSFPVSDVRIVLGRAGSNISEDDKNSIIRELEEDSSLAGRSEYLKFFLDQLLSIYQSQREYDTAIKSFVAVCNKYLVDKQFIYDESSLSLGIYRNNDISRKEKLELRCLSSGEKQIVSIFSQLYLLLDKSYAILFDEPELSLSITWQSNLLSDILESKKCSFLLAVTHSPFIFQNDLAQFTESIATYVR